MMTAVANHLGYLVPALMVILVIMIAVISTISLSRRADWFKQKFYQSDAELTEHRAFIRYFIRNNNFAIWSDARELIIRAFRENVRHEAQRLIQTAQGLGFCSDKDGYVTVKWDLFKPDYLNSAADLGTAERMLKVEYKRMLSRLSRWLECAKTVGCEDVINDTIKEAGVKTSEEFFLYIVKQELLQHGGEPGGTTI